MGLVLAAGFAAGIRVAAANEGADPDILALMAQAPNDQAPGTCDVPKATASAKDASEPKAAEPKESGSTKAPNASKSSTESGSAKASASGEAKKPKPAKSSAAAAASASSTAPKLPPGCDHHGEETGPVATDFIKIEKVTNRVHDPKPGRGASTGTFVSLCGRNENNHRNSDNYIVAPGVSNGAHHVHDYVGNTSTDGFSTNESLAAAGTTCAGNDRSPYFWPVLRYRSKSAPDANAPGGGQDGNTGTILRPDSVQLQFRGNADTKVHAMPKFLRIITGDAKALTNGVTNARAAWTCTGFEDRATVKYPICPAGSKVERTLDFPSCWDGKNTDSTNHRSHVVFPKSDGSCWQETEAIPQLRITLTYNIPARALFAVDTFPEQKHSPVTDHADFTNVMPDNLMKMAVDCINGGRDCDANGPVDAGQSTGNPTGSANPAESAPAESASPSEAQPAPPKQSTPAGGKSATKGAGKPEHPASPQGQPQNPPPAQNPPAQPQNPPAQPQNPPAQPQNPPAQPQNPPAQPQNPPAAGGTAPAVPPAPANPGGANGGGAANPGAPNAGAPDTVPTDPDGYSGPPAGSGDNTPTEEIPGDGAAADLTAPPPTPGVASGAKKSFLPATGNRVALYAFNGVALTTLAGWLMMLYRRRRLR
jgi:hypothetical protein